MPERLKQRSMASRKRPSTGVAVCAAAAARWACSAAIPSPVLAETGRWGFGKRALREQCAYLGFGSVGARCIGNIALGQRDGRTLQTEQLGDRQMLPRLRHRPVIRGDDEQQEIDAGGPGQHVVDQLLVAGDVDEAKCAAVGQRV